MRALAFAATVLAGIVPSHALNSAVVYFTNLAVLYRVPETGGQPEQLVPEGIHGKIPGVAIDAVRRQVYWVDDDHLAPFAMILRRSLDGGPVQSVVSVWGYPAEEFGEVDIDEVAGLLYWSTDRENGSILRANLDGSDIQTVADSVGSNVRGIAVSPSTEYVYWTTHESAPGSGKIRRALRSGGAPEDLLIGLDQPHALALSADSQLYWTETILGRICRTETQSPGIVIVLEGLDSPRGLGFDAAMGRMFWGEGNNMGLLRIATPSGGEITTIALNLFAPYALDIAPGSIAVLPSAWGDVKNRFR